MARRSKSAPYVRRQPLAFTVFGEPGRRMEYYVLRAWIYEGDEPEQIVCATLEVLERQKLLMIQCDLEMYERYLGASAP
jgi:hypothetical protein